MSLTFERSNTILMLGSPYLHHPLHVRLYENAGPSLTQRMGGIKQNKINLIPISTATNFCSFIIERIALLRWSRANKKLQALINTVNSKCYYRPANQFDNNEYSKCM